MRLHSRLLFAGIVLFLCTTLFAYAEEKQPIALTILSKGNVDVSQDTSGWLPLAFGDMIADSNRIQTGDDGFAAMAFVDDGSQLKVRPDTKLIFYGTFNDDHSLLKRIHIELGEVLSEVKRQKGAAQISTPTSVASVKGTSFWTQVDEDGTTRVTTLEGEVEVVNLRSGDSALVPAGKTVVSTPDGQLTVSDAEDAPVYGEEPGVGQEEMFEKEEQADPKPRGGKPGAGGGAAKTGVQMSGAAGATVIDDQTYQFFSLRPDISIGKVGIGLDLPFYFDADGNLRDEDWNEAADAIDKIFYVRYGLPGDPVYVRAGALENVTLGYGMIMRRYSNAIEWPQVRRIGLHTQVNRGNVGAEALVGNIREIDSPGLVAGRLTYEIPMLLPVVVGGSVAYDGNQYLGAKDTDDDDVPDPFDRFPGDNDDDKIAEIYSIVNDDVSIIRDLIGGGFLPDILTSYPKLSELDGDVTVWGADIGVPLIRRQTMGLWLYTQMAQIQNYGRGYTVPGVSFNMGPFRAGAEYRIFEKEFAPDYFNLGYEVERVVWNEDLQAYITKSSKLNGLPSARGYYVDAGMMVSNLFDIYAAYQQIVYDDDTAVEDANKTLFGRASINTDPIPKLGLAEAYLYQPNAENLFKSKTDGMTVGYRLGFELSPGFMIVYDNRTVYRDEKPTKMMTVETVFTF